DEGGYGPHLESNRAALHLLCRAIEAAGFEPGRHVSMALDVAASHFCEGGFYCLENRKRTAAEMTAMLGEWAAAYPLVSGEDPLAEDDWDGWKQLTAGLSKLQLIGDDLFATNLGRLERGVLEGAANAVLVKMNQIGTLTETFEVIDRARQAGYNVVIS